jgi:pimeloyl-ACP methyl ester carboxylesterase
MVQEGEPRVDRLTVRDVDLEVVRRGAGQPIVFLHGFHAPDPDSRFLERLSRKATIIAPSHPGFGASARPDDFESAGSARGRRAWSAFPWWQRPSPNATAPRCWAS